MLKVFKLYVKISACLLLVGTSIVFKSDAAAAVKDRGWTGSCGLYGTQLQAAEQQSADLVFVLLGSDGTILGRQWTSAKGSPISVPLMWSTMTFLPQVASVRCQVVRQSAPEIRECDDKWPSVDEGPFIAALDVLWGSNWLVAATTTTYKDMISGTNPGPEGSILGYELDNRKPDWLVVDTAGRQSVAYFNLRPGAHTLTIGNRDPGKPGDPAVLFPQERVCLSI
jgi:hypothetical protein